MEQGPDRAQKFKGVEPMGRGRAKAKQVKVARQLKYNSGGTSLDRLRAELGVGESERDDEHDESPYDDLADRYADDDDDADDEDDEDDERWDSTG
jgi:hypothetical protein